jgi:DNA polymerase-3 subunit alpha (Gram-positive type)
MTDKKTSLLELFPDSTLDPKLRAQTSVLKVELDRTNMKMQIVLKGKFNAEDRVVLFEELSDKFNNFEIKIEYEENKMSMTNNDLIEIIKNKISKHIPSSMSWLGDIVILEDDDYIIQLPHYIAYQSVSRNGIQKELEELVANERKKTLIFRYGEMEISEEYLVEKELEERKILKEIISGKPEQKKKDASKLFVIGKKIKKEPIKIVDVDLQFGSAVIAGTVFQLEMKQIKDNRSLGIFYISDGSNSIAAKLFLNADQVGSFETSVLVGSELIIEGDIVYDSFSKEVVLMVKSLESRVKSIMKDKADEKRVELHLHTNMSAMDGVSTAKSLIKRAIDWGHSAIAITDHGVVQAFPDAMEFAKDIKIIYGVEAYMINDRNDIITGCYEDLPLNNFVVFDIETTGLSARNDRITEIGAVRIVNGEIIETYSQLVNPCVEIPENIVKLTGIDNNMVSDKPTIENILPNFIDFVGDSILVAHNATFDTGFLREAIVRINREFESPVCDTLQLSRVLFPTLKNHKLHTLAKHLKIELINHHRAVDDAIATAGILSSILKLLDEKEIKTVFQLNEFISKSDSGKGETFHTIILAKNQKGLKDLYNLITESHINYFYRKPRMPKSLIAKYRSDLLIGSACEAGELYKALLTNRSDNEIYEIVDFYDYLEIQPIENNAHLIREGTVKNEDELKDIVRKTYNLGKLKNKPVVATGDVHFLEPEDEVYRRILMSGQKFQDADYQAPLFFRTTQQMLDEFKYLGADIAKEVVINNPSLISEKIEKCKPIPDGTYPPKIEGADEELKTITYSKAFEIYGDPLPEIVKTRLDRELESIIKNGYAVMYIIAQKLVWKSIEDGYLVGSRGSVGSSLVATMSGITEVNPLLPHYICPCCKNSEFVTNGSVASGYDLPDANCPICGCDFIKEGHDIPFEVFLGFEGDKEPDIDLNFAGEYQAKAHKYTEELFGIGKVFRAGTIGTIADKTAYGFVKKYFEERDIPINQAEVNRLLKGCTGIKRSSGQHPGGVMIVPDYKDIHDFTPVQYPADDKDSGVITTHFDYHAISGRILKLDILGHDVPSIIRMLEDITGVNPINIPLDDEETMSLFTSTKALGTDSDRINCPVGTLGIPEFGTKFVRQMLIETHPTTFSELVRISGLSHGTDVWINNAQDLVKNGIAPLSQVISTREDIMLSLISAGMDKKQAFFIMEKVRKGKGLSSEDEKSMRTAGMPEWYIESCNRIKYMFPKAHAAAYVTMSFRIAFFKVHYPEAFYATYFTTKAADFDAELVIQGEDMLKIKIAEIEQKGITASAKEKNQLTVLEVALEMYARGFSFERVDLYKSHSDKFLLGEGGILPPLKALEGVGENAARKLVEEREASSFISIQDLIQRGKATRPVIDALQKHGCLDFLPKDNQISLFNI